MPRSAAQALAIGTEDLDFLDRRGAEDGGLHPVEVRRRAAVDALRRQFVERVDACADAGLGERNRALGGGVDFLLALPVDQPAEPEIEGEQRRAGQQDASADRNDVPARKCAHKSKPFWRPGPQPLLVSD